MRCLSIVTLLMAVIGWPHACAQNLPPVAAAPPRPPAPPLPPPSPPQPPSPPPSPPSPPSPPPSPPSPRPPPSPQPRPPPFWQQQRQQQQQWQQQQQQQQQWQQQQQQQQQQRQQQQQQQQQQQRQQQQQQQQQQQVFHLADTEPYRPVLLSGRMLPEGRGLDWSLAGYREGFMTVPFPPIRYNVKMMPFGAKGDGVADDTEAIQRAINAANAAPGVVYFPAGTYILTRPFTVYRGRVVLRGAGEGLTIIHIPLSLGEVYPGTYKEEGGNVETTWNSGGGFINFSGRRQRSDNGGTLLGLIEEPVSVGSNRIPVRNPGRFRVGQRIRIYVNDRSTWDSGADARRKLLRSEEEQQKQQKQGSQEAASGSGGSGEAGTPHPKVAAITLPAGLRFLTGSVPSWVLEDPVVQAALDGANLLRAGDKGGNHDDDEEGHKDAEDDGGGELAWNDARGVSAEFGAPAPQPDSPAPAPAPGPGSGPAPGPAPGDDESQQMGLPLLSTAAANASKMSLRAASLVDEDGADVGTLAAWIYGDNMVDSGAYKSGVVDKDEVAMSARVASVGPDHILLDRGMPFPVKTEAGWVGVVHQEAPTIEDSGIEFMTIRFKHTLVGPHHTDKGYNAIQVANVANFWTRNVTVLNSDTAIYYSWIHRSLIQDVTLGVTMPRANPLNRYNGHHGICITEGQSNLVTRLRVPSPFIHDITITSSSSMNVVQDSAGTNLNLDHHRTAPFANLYTNLNMGHGTRPFESGGRGDRGAHSGRGNTYWNLRSSTGRPLVLPSCDWGPILNFVGPFVGNACPDKAWMVRPLYSMPANLYRAQRYRFGRVG